MRRIIKRKIAVAAVAAFSVMSVLAPKTAWSQGRTWAGESLAQMVDSARWRLDFIRVNGALELINTGYDSDIYYGYLPEPVPDFTLSAGARVQLLIPVNKSIVIDLYEYPQYVYYLATEKERAWNNRFRGQLHIALKKFYFQAGGSMSDVRNRLSPELDVNIREKTDRLDGVALWQASRQTSLAVVYGRAKHDFGESIYGDRDIAQYLNRIEDVADLNFYVQPSPRIRFFMSGQYGKYDFLDEADPSRDAQSYGIFGGAEFLPKEGELLEATGIEGGFSLGYQELDLKDPYFVDGSGITGQGDISFQFLRRTRLQAFFSRGFQFSIYSGVSYYLATTLGGGVTRQFSRKTAFHYVFSYGRIYYPTTGAPEGFFTHYMAHMISLELRLSKSLIVTGFAALGRRVMEQNNEAQSRNFFGINIIYGYPPARISAPIRRMTQ